MGLGLAKEYGAVSLLLSKAMETGSERNDFIAMTLCVFWSYALTYE